MDTEHGSNGREPQGQRTGPVQGLRLRPLPVCSDPSFPVLHDYFEVVYCPLIGPSSMFLARALARHVGTAVGPVTICPIELSLELGLRASHDEPIGKSSPLAKAIDRLAHHRLVKYLGTDTLGVVMAVPPMGASSLERMPASIRAGHDHFLAQPDVDRSAPRSWIDREAPLADR